MKKGGLRWEGFAENEGDKPGMKEWVGEGKLSKYNNYDLAKVSSISSPPVKQKWNENQRRCLAAMHVFRARQATKIM